MAEFSSGFSTICVHHLHERFICLPERLLLKMLHTYVGKMLSRGEFSHRPQPTSLNNKDLHNIGHESLSQFIMYTHYSHASLSVIRMNICPVPIIQLCKRTFLHSNLLPSQVYISNQTMKVPNKSKFQSINLICCSIKYKANML